jgi:hypothetical protein
VVEGDILHRPAGRFENRFDCLEYVARLRFHVAFANQVTGAVERERTRQALVPGKYGVSGGAEPFGIMTS